MPYLFAITVVAFVALLWAAFSAAQHIRRARRRRRMAWTSTLPDTHSTPAAEPWLDPLPPAELHAPPPPPQPASAGAIRFPLNSQRSARFDAGDLSDPIAGSRWKDRNGDPR